MEWGVIRWTVRRKLQRSTAIGRLVARLFMTDTQVFKMAACRRWKFALTSEIQTSLSDKIQVRSNNVWLYCEVYRCSIVYFVMPGWNGMRYSVCTVTIMCVHKSKKLTIIHHVPLWTNVIMDLFVLLMMLFFSWVGTYERNIRLIKGFS